MKKLILAAAGACCAAVIYKLLTPIRASAWFSDAHRELSSAALGLLEKENKQKQLAFYKPYIEQLMKGCVDPDNENDPDKGPGTHYYSCALPNGKTLPQKNGYYPNRLGDYARSARTAMEENYTAAVLLYKNNKPEQAIYALGRAIHFIEDIACPVHTANMQYKAKPSNPHYAFEKLANTIIGKYKPEKSDGCIEKSYFGNDFGEALNKLSLTANRHAAAISKLDPRDFEAAVKEMAPIASQNVMALLLRFYDDCRCGRGYMVRDGEKYSLRSEASGLLVTVSPNGLSLEPADSQKEQKLTLEQSGLGSFAFKTEKSGYVPGSLNGYEYPESGAEPSQFRLAALGNNRYRITIKAQGYSKVLACTKSGALAAADFIPGEKSQIWLLG